MASRTRCFESAEKDKETITGWWLARNARGLAISLHSGGRRRHLGLLAAVITEDFVGGSRRICDPFDENGIGHRITIIVRPGGKVYF